MISIPKIKIIGIGPGHPDYVLPIAIKMIRQSTYLVGGKRHLQVFGDKQNQRLIPITAKIEELLDDIEANHIKEHIGIIVSGDPGFYSFLTTIKRRFQDDELEVYPGISAIQYLFAKGALPWNDAYVTSFHGRTQESLHQLVAEHSKVALFTDAKHHPNWIIEQLNLAGICNKKILVGENLSYDDERITKCHIDDWQGGHFNNLNVMVIYDE